MRIASTTSGNPGSCAGVRRLFDLGFEAWLFWCLTVIKCTIFLYKAGLVLLGISLVGVTPSLHSDSIQQFMLQRCAKVGGDPDEEDDEKDPNIGMYKVCQTSQKDQQEKISDVEILSIKRVVLWLLKTVCIF